ncbi:NRDE family protein [Elongatibacter sediminis]|uniref:NRDE family protein n=1 Tax=Elongatibacter sediminis TaxID=3119006 RepID=A0AAW9RGE7_9GAMM
MCLILFAWRTHPRYRLVLAANRDEFHARPTAAAQFWDDHPGLLAGRDLQAGGTWLGVTGSGRFAAITNYREPRQPEPPPARSRGHLVRDVLIARAAPSACADRVAASGQAYGGFSLLLGDADELVCVSNRAPAPVAVSAGVHALSNHLIDTDWPKVRRGRERLSAALEAERIDPDALLELLAHDRPIAGEEPPGFDPRLDPERLSRLLFIRSPEYGTRSSSVVLIDHEGRLEFVERQYGPEGGTIDTRRFSLEPDRA